ncbi:putative small auxin-up RNA [Lupinus albus]|uniref:Putative small auxin-up RNA n=1 Tax=Lupinus albus TaxID=3870 RepID=A0A6A4QPU5_LUPAL|nr:putative small auxin-up RNA [Lupinus albus]
MLGSGLKNFKQIPHTYHHHHHHRRQEVVTKNVPKGCLAIKVGQGEEQQKIMVPVMYLNHPLFAPLLKEAEEEYGFSQQGTITIPCQVEDFMYVQDLIDRERFLQHNHYHHLVGCFKA